jgi:hypothetical protein
VLRRFKTAFELRGSSSEGVCYQIKAPLDLHTDRVSAALIALGPVDKTAVEWTEKKPSDD